MGSSSDDTIHSTESQLHVAEENVKLQELMLATGPISECANGRRLRAALEAMSLVLTRHSWKRSSDQTHRPCRSSQAAPELTEAEYFLHPHVVLVLLVLLKIALGLEVGQALAVVADLVTLCFTLVLDDPRPSGR